MLPLDAAAATDEVRVGPKAASLARLVQAGLPVPEGVCVPAEAYREHLARAGLAATARELTCVEGFEARRRAVAIRLGFSRVELEASLVRGLDDAWRRLAAPLAVRSTALCENTAPASFAGQFETFLGIAERADLDTALRACWASLWSTRALRYMRAYDLDPAASAMAVLVQRMVPAEAAGGAFSLTPDDQIVLTGTWGLGSAIAQGDVVPDRFVMRRDGSLESIEPGRKDHLVTTGSAGPQSRAVPRERARTPCLGESEAVELARLVLRAERVLNAAVEMEWAKDASGFWLLQARPLKLEARPEIDAVWTRRPALTGQPAGVGWGTGPACIVHEERDLDRVPFGSVIVTEVGGPALSAVLPRAAGVVAELGGSTSHLAALARERGIPAVLGARGATRSIPEGSTVAVDGITGVVRWAR
ncbi:MAG TPA: PEP/pyruvate-binding domain-containing protein [Methylomirabilota bacterium]|nr:PEP/pyruvate-binding domain-containing protein [Methylomirabilota bacterium]